MTIRIKPKLFLCHSSHDKAFVRRLATDLLSLGIIPWFDEWQLSPGDSLHEAIGKALRDSAYVAIVLSRHSLNSKWCQRELSEALAREIKMKRPHVIPLKRKITEVPPFLSDKLYINFATSYFQALAELVGFLYKINPLAISMALQKTRPSSILEVKRFLRIASGNKMIVFNFINLKQFEDISRQMKLGHVRPCGNIYAVSRSPIRRKADISSDDLCK